MSLFFRITKHYSELYYGVKKFDYLILGASGMQGSIVSRDLLEKGNKVLLTDIYKDGSRKNLQNFPAGAGFRYLDVRHFRKMVALIRASGANVVVNCVESDWNYGVHRACLTAGVHVVDLDSEIFITKKQLAMNDQFKKKSLTAITGCGSTPGINSVMLNYAQKQLDSIETINLGFCWDSNMDTFVVPFSIPSIVWEFTHPATVVENGKVLSLPPLSKTVDLDLKIVGKQKGYIAEHTEVETFHYYFKNKGLKNIHFYTGFPEHSSKIIHQIIDLGLAELKKISIGGDHGVKIAPMDLTTQVFRQIKYPSSYLEVENLWVEIIGEKDGQKKKILMECIVPPLKGWEDAGCNIDTGFPASIITQMIKDGRITERGSFAPEAGVVPEEEFFRELQLKGMTVYQDGVAINNSKYVRQHVPKTESMAQIELFV